MDRSNTSNHSLYWTLFAQFVAVAPFANAEELSKISKNLLEEKTVVRSETNLAGISPYVHSLLFDQKQDAHSYQPLPVSLQGLQLKAMTAQDLLTETTRVAATPSRTPAKIAEKPSDDAQDPLRAPQSFWVWQQSALRTPAQEGTATAVAVQKSGGAIQQLASSLAVPSDKPVGPTKPKLPPLPNRAPASTVAINTKKFNIPKDQRESAVVYVISEESLSDDAPQAVAGATIEWVGYNSGLHSQTNAGGLARLPYPFATSMRFVVKAPGYLPAVGYAVAGLSTPVVLFKEERLPAILKSLGVVQDPQRRIVLGKALTKALKPLAGITFDANLPKPLRPYYSMGTFGLFHPAALETGPQGDFLLPGVGDGLQYVLPTQNLPHSLKDVQDEGRSTSEWPASIVDFSGLPSVVTMTVLEGKPMSLETQVVDGMALEVPEVAVHATVGGQRGIHTANEDGDLKITDIYQRNSVDLIEIQAQGYLKTWLSAVPKAGNFPTSVSVFTRVQLEDIFRTDLVQVQFSKGIVFGHLRPEKYKRPVEVMLVDNRGRRSATAKIFYFDEDNVARSTAHATTPSNQTFAVVNLEPGEWHLIAKDVASGQGIGGQVVRTDQETVTQVEL